ncbi:MAG: bifunctional transcriptional activator/DNA repair enzyme AdaA [Lutisporaceae bacterium]|jgi:AraC family transcriptional regulator of adaptative response / methylphosphotriester-DNA alkyltransferase methyltransferase
MGEYFLISDNEKWQAVVNCDKGYDGLFFYGVKTTGIFCRPSCRAKTPARENVVFFDNAVNAIGEGFRPCKRCRPDEAVFEPNLELVNKVKDIIEANFDKPIDINYISKQLGVSTNHLIRLFKQNSGHTPTHYITKLRVSKSVELLEQADKNIIEIAYMTGFNSLSNFYKHFKEQIGQAPNEYRKSRGGL